MLHRYFVLLWLNTIADRTYTREYVNHIGEVAAKVEPDSDHQVVLGEMNFHRIRQC